MWRNGHSEGRVTIRASAARFWGAESVFPGIYGEKTIFADFHGVSWITNVRLWWGVTECRLDARSPSSAGAAGLLLATSVRQLASDRWRFAMTPFNPRLM